MSYDQQLADALATIHQQAKAIRSLKRKAARKDKALFGVLHHNLNCKPGARLPESLINHITNTLK